MLKKKQRTHTHALSRFCSVTQKSRGVGVLKAKVCFSTAEQQWPTRGSEGAAALTPVPRPSASWPQCYLQVKELLYPISLFLVYEKEAEENRRCWPMMESGRERMRACSCGSEDHKRVGKKGMETQGSLNLRVHTSMDGETEILSLLLGFLTFLIKYSLLRVFIWDNSWANSLGISVSLLILTFCF